MRDLSKKELQALIPKIELYPVNNIKLDPDNPRTITQKKFDSLVKSLEEFWLMLFYRPVILDENGQCLGGNMRTLAARKAGFNEIPVIHAAQLSETQRREFVIKDNLAFGDWNFDALANSWDEDLLGSWGFNVPAFTSFNDMEQTSGEFGSSGSGSSGSSRQLKSNAPSFNVLVRLADEKTRAEFVELLNSRGFHLDEHFFFV